MEREEVDVGGSTGKGSTFHEYQQRQAALQTPNISLSRLKDTEEGQKKWGGGTFM